MKVKELLALGKGNTLVAGTKDAYFFIAENKAEENIFLGVLASGGKESIPYFRVFELSYAEALMRWRPIVDLFQDLPSEVFTQYHFLHDRLVRHKGEEIEDALEATL